VARQAGEEGIVTSDNRELTIQSVNPHANYLMDGEFCIVTGSKEFVEVTKKRIENYAANCVAQKDVEILALRTAFNKFALNVMVAAIEGVADAAIVKQAIYTEHTSLDAVRTLAEKHKSLRARVAELEEALRKIAGIPIGEYGSDADYEEEPKAIDGVPEFANREELEAFLAKMEEEMREAAKKFEFERAAKMRDLIRELRLERDRRGKRTSRSCADQ